MYLLDFNHDVFDISGLNFEANLSALFMDIVKTYTKSVKKFIRSEKARIRRQFFDVKKQDELIKEVYNRVNPVNKTK